MIETEKQEIVTKFEQAVYYSKVYDDVHDTNLLKTSIKLLIDVGQQVQPKNRLTVYRTALGIAKKTKDGSTIGEVITQALESLDEMDQLLLINDYE